MFRKYYIYILITILAPTLAAAQARMVGNVLVREDLKGAVPKTPPRASPGLVVVETVPQGAEFTCPRGVCQIPLLITRGGFVDKNLTVWDESSCSVYLPYYKITVTKRSFPTLRWILIKDPADSQNYAFDATYGIGLQSNPNDPSDFNDPSLDLFNGRRDASDGRAFVWQDLHARPQRKEITFIPDVYRIVDKRVCNSGDPVVVNEN